MAIGLAEAFERVIKERDEGNKETLARILAAITEEAGEVKTARRILLERVEADQRRMMAEKKQLAALWSNLGRPKTEPWRGFVSRGHLQMAVPSLMTAAVLLWMKKVLRL
jgi:hypothetical protein